MNNATKGFLGMPGPNIEDFNSWEEYKAARNEYKDGNDASNFSADESNKVDGQHTVGGGLILILIVIALVMLFL